MRQLNWTRPSAKESSHPRCEPLTKTSSKAKFSLDRTILLRLIIYEAGLTGTFAKGEDNEIETVCPLIRITSGSALRLRQSQ
jgi:hypothetical protein